MGPILVVAYVHRLGYHRDCRCLFPELFPVSRLLLFKAEPGTCSGVTFHESFLNVNTGVGDL